LDNDYKVPDRDANFNRSASIIAIYPDFKNCEVTQREVELSMIEHPHTLLLFDMVTSPDNWPGRRCGLMKSVQRRSLTTVEGFARFGDNASNFAL
jgi:hypothetical protein